MALTWAPCPSLCLHAAQPRVSCRSPHQHRTVEETNREGRRERQGGSVFVCVPMRESRAGWADTARPQLSEDSAPPSFFVLRCSRFPKQVMLVSPLTQSTCPALLIRAVWVLHCLTERVHHREGGLGTATSLHISKPLGLVNAALWGLAWYVQNTQRERERDPGQKRERERQGERKGGRVELAVCPDRQSERMGCRRGLWTTGGGELCVCLCVNEYPCVHVHECGITVCGYTWGTS